MATNQSLTTMNISLPARLRAFVTRQVREGGYTSASEFFRHLLRVAQQNVETDAKLLKAVERGGSIEVDDRYWQDKKDRLASLVRKKLPRKA
jgi:antitoxin ParD1/3/4